MVALDHVLLLSGLLFGIGAIGVLVRRNLLIVLISLQLMLAAGQLALITFERALSVADPGVGGLPSAGQSFALFVMVVAAAQMVVGLSIVVAVVRGRDSVDIEEASMMKW